MVKGGSSFCSHESYELQQEKIMGIPESIFGD